MIISASRRTDIPAYYSEWFFNRLKEGFCHTVNPMNPSQYLKISLKKEVVDCIVFWTKNPYPMLKKLHLLHDYQYYFHYTITPYSNDIEHNLPLKRYLIDTFKKLSEQIGKQRIIWRYDPVLLSPVYTKEFHIKYFECFCKELSPYTTKVIISFLSLYRKNRNNCEQQELTSPCTQDRQFILRNLARIASAHGLRLEICSNDFQSPKDFPVYASKCIDLDLINTLTGKNLMIEKSPNQREGCNCAKSYDIGMYNSCYNGCMYCYASYKNIRLEENKQKHFPSSPILLGYVPENAQIIEKNSITPNNKQLFLWKQGNNGLFQ